MTHKEALNISRRTKLVPDDKFDSHMSRARIRDIDNRKAIFDRQTENSIQTREKRLNIQSSVY
jgi:hypothetical protein